MTRQGFVSGIVAVLALAASSVVQPAEVSEETRAQFAKAGALMGEDKFAEALPLLKEVVAKVPEGFGAWANLGLAAAMTGNHELALQARLKYRELRPDDLQGKSRLMETYQSLGRARDRDAQRAELVAQWTALPPADQQKSPIFVRDQFDAGGMHVIVVEFFKPAAPINRLYRFDVLNAERKVAYFFGLESGDSTTNIARELGTIKKDERIYSLDRYETRGQTAMHATFGLMNALPDYDTVRTMVVNAMEGKLQPGSSSTRPIPQP